MRRLVLAAAISMAAFAVAPAFAAAQGFQKRTLHLIVHIGPRSATACNVIADLYKPKGASQAHPVPAVLTTNGFGGSKNSQDTLAEDLASRGFAVLSYSGLGFGRSSCRIELDSTQWDGAAASQLVTFLGGGSAATNGTRVNYVIHDRLAHNGRHYADDPRLAMIGASYGGEVQFARRPSRIRGSTRSSRSSPGTTSRTRSPRTTPISVLRAEGWTRILRSPVSVSPKRAGSTPSCTWGMDRPRSLRRAARLAARTSQTRYAGRRRSSATTATPIRQR